MKQSEKIKDLRLFIPIMVFLCLGVFIIFSSGTNSSDVQETSVSAEFVSESSPNNCMPAGLPVQVNFDLLNDPQGAGDMAFFELELISRIDHDDIKVYFILPDGTVRESGDDWEGVLEINEGRKLDAGIRIDTEEAIAIKAVVEITREDTTFRVGKSFQIDLGDKEHASLDQLVVSGFAGADTLNIIVPAGN